MSKLIVEMEMPPHCGECNLHCDGSFEDGNGYCRGVSPYMDYECRPSYEQRPSWCPIKGVLPDEHGDLIDRTVLLQAFQNADYETYNDYCEAFDTVEAAETVIAAERKDDEQIH